MPTGDDRAYLAACQAVGRQFQERRIRKPVLTPTLSVTSDKSTPSSQNRFQRPLEHFDQLGQKRDEKEESNGDTEQRYGAYHHETAKLVSSSCHPLPRERRSDWPSVSN